MRPLVPLILLLVACSSTPQNPYRPTVIARQLNAMNFGATTSAPITVEVDVTNRHTQPITIQRIRLEGGLTQQYILAPAERSLREVIGPGETRSVRLSMTAVSQQGRIQDPEPLNLRGFVSYLVGEQQYQDLYIFRPMMQ